MSIILTITAIILTAIIFFIKPPITVIDSKEITRREIEYLSSEINTFVSEHKITDYKSLYIKEKIYDRIVEMIASDEIYNIEYNKLILFYIVAEDFEINETQRAILLEEFDKIFNRLISIRRFYE